MGLKEILQDEIVIRQGKLQILNSVAADTFSIGTIMVFDTGSIKWYYVKVAEESWRDMNNSITKRLAEWILDAKESPRGYFEVYELRVQPTPFYASA